MLDGSIISEQTKGLKMYPVLLKTPFFSLHTYGLFIAIGYFLATKFASQLAEKENLDSKKINELGFWVFFIGFAASRVLYIITRLDYFIENPIEIFYFWQGGFVFLGGLIGAVAYGQYYIRKHKFPLWKTLDLGFISLTLGHIFGRIGCFFAGCCHGSSTTMPWGIKIHENVENNLVHPTQLYESFSLFLLFVLLFRIYRNKKFDGQVALVYLIVYPVVRIFIEIFRGDKLRGFVIQNLVSTSQFISILILSIASVVLLKKYKNYKNHEHLNKIVPLRKLTKKLKKIS